jgi:serine protease AprX
MPGKHETSRTGNSILKTTTWGSLIAFSAVMLLAGSLRYSSSTSSSDLHGPSAHVEEHSQSAASHTAAPVQIDSTQTGKTLTLPHHAKSSPAEAAVPQVSASAAATVPNPIRSNQTDLGHSSAPINDSGASSASTSRDDDHLVAAAKIAPDLKGVDPEAPVDVIVQFKSAAGASDVAAEGATAKSDLSLVHAQLVTIKGSSLSSLASHSSVAYISPNRPLRGSLEHVVTAVNGDLAYASGWNGTGIGIAVIDSGVSRSVYDLNTDDNSSSRVVYNQSFVPGDSSTDDAFGHGTHIAAILGGNGYGSRTSNYTAVYRGIASEAAIINLRVLDSTGSGTDSTVISAIQQAVALRSTYNIRVINLSLSRGVYESYTLDPLCQAVESAWRAGIVVVAAAGNMGQYNGAGTNGYSTIGAPGNDPYVITVGATNTHGNGNQTSQSVTSYSSKGPTSFDHIVKPDLVAPGNAVVSRMSSSGNALVSSYPALAVYPCNSSRSSCGPQYGSARYMRLSGTSMATPVVSGAAAVVRELLREQLQCDKPSAALLKAILIASASKMPSFSPQTGDPWVALVGYPDFHQGFGRIDLAAVLPHPQAPAGRKLLFDDVRNGADAALQAQPPVGGKASASRTYRIQVAAGAAEPLRVVLAWTDVPGKYLHNSLQLYIEGPGLVKVGNGDLLFQRNPFQLDQLQHAAAPADVKAGGVPFDKHNNVESVRLDNPPAGDYLISILAQYTDPENKAQGYALCVSGPLESQKLEPV